MCDFSSLACWWFVLLLFTKDFIRLGEYSLMKHLVLCKFLLMAGKSVSRAWYTLDSEKASSRFLDWKLQLPVDENNSLHLHPYCVVWDDSFGCPFPFACCCAHLWVRSWGTPSVISAPWTNISGNHSMSFKIYFLLVSWKAPLPGTGYFIVVHGRDTAIVTHFIYFLAIGPSVVVNREK